MMKPRLLLMPLLLCVICSVSVDAYWPQPLDFTLGPLPNETTPSTIDSKARAHIPQQDVIIGPYPKETKPSMIELNTNVEKKTFGRPEMSPVGKGVRSGLLFIKNVLQGMGEQVQQEYANNMTREREHMVITTKTNSFTSSTEATIQMNVQPTGTEEMKTVEISGGPSKPDNVTVSASSNCHHYHLCTSILLVTFTIHFHANVKTLNG